MYDEVGNVMESELQKFENSLTSVPLERSYTRSLDVVNYLNCYILHDTV